MYNLCEQSELIAKGVAYDQVRWERDVAIQQLEEAGMSFGAKAQLRLCIEKEPLLAYLENMCVSKKIIDVIANENRFPVYRVPC